MNVAALLWALAVIAATGSVGVAVLAGLVLLRRRRLRRRYLGDDSEDVPGRRGERWVESLSSGGARVNGWLTDGEETRTLLAQAGWRTARARAAFYAFQMFLPLVALVTALVGAALVDFYRGPMPAVMLAAALLIVSLLAPRYVLRSIARRRRERLAEEVPLFINVLVLLFESGLNLRQALYSLVRDGRQTLPTLNQELEPMLRQIEAGADAATLLKDAGKLLDIEDLDTVFGILRQVERYGGEIREPLLEVLEILQNKRAMQLRETVNVLAGKMTVVLVLCFLPPLLIIIGGPAVISISRALGNMG